MKIIQNILLTFILLSLQSIATHASDRQSTNLIGLASIFHTESLHSRIGIQGTEPIRNIILSRNNIIQKFNGNTNEPLTTKHQFMQCLICLDNTHIDEIQTLECKHSFCKECLHHIIDNALEEKQTSTLQCSMIDCRKKFEHHDIMKIVTNSKKRTLLGKIQTNEWMKQQPGFKQCPTPDCDYMFINDEQVKCIMTCKICRLSYCSNCLLLHPNKMSCDYAEYLAGNPHKANNEWLKTHTKKCPNCHKNIEKNDGCNHMTCQRGAGGCGHQFCWLCLGAWTWHRESSCIQLQEQEHLRIIERDERINNGDFETDSHDEDEIFTEQSICNSCTIS